MFAGSANSSEELSYKLLNFKLSMLTDLGFNRFACDKFPACHPHHTNLVENFNPSWGIERGALITMYDFARDSPRVFDYALLQMDIQSQEVVGFDKMMVGLKKVEDRRLLDVLNALSMSSVYDLYSS